MRKSTPVTNAINILQACIYKSACFHFKISSSLAEKHDIVALDTLVASNDFKNRPVLTDL